MDSPGFPGHGGDEEAAGHNDHLTTYYIGSACFILTISNPYNTVSDTSEFHPQ